MGLSFGFGALFKCAWLCSNYITCNVCIFITSSFSCMEISMIFSTNFTSKNIICFQRLSDKIQVLSWRWQNIGLASWNPPNLTNLHVLSLVSYNISWIQRIGDSGSFKIYICYIPIVHCIIISYLLLVSLEGMGSCLCTLYVMYIHYITCRNIDLLLFGRSRSWNIINKLLISNKFDRFRL